MERKRSLDFGPEAGPDDGDPVEKKRLLLCVDFSAIASCEAAVARRYLTENAWEMEVRSPGSLGTGPRAARLRPRPPVCLFSEGAERLLRAAGGGGRRPTRRGDRARAGVLVSWPGRAGLRWRPRWGRRRARPPSGFGRPREPSEVLHSKYIGNMQARGCKQMNEAKASMETR